MYGANDLSRLNFYHAISGLRLEPSPLQNSAHATASPMTCGPQTLSCLGALALLLLTTLTRADAPPWLAPGWTNRVLVQVIDPTPDGEDDSDVAAAHIMHGGLAAPSADDYRVFNPEGKPVPYLVTFHDPRRDSLISFRWTTANSPTRSSPGPKGYFSIYYGKRDAPRDPLRAILDERPGSGPPKPGPGAGGWTPRAGLVFATYRRPKDAPNPENPADMAKMLERALPSPDGAAHRTNISDSFNPFGDSDYFVSAYRGWITLPKAGKWGFCTASNEASFSYLDGKDLVHWPGRHTEDRGRFGEQNVMVEAAAGPHYVEYYMEEVLLYQLSFLGYKPPGEAHYVGIPSSLFIQPRRAVIASVECLVGQNAEPTLTLKPTLIDSVWPVGRPDTQYTRYAFVADGGSNNGKLTGWNLTLTFSDGVVEKSGVTQHVFLKNGEYTVRLQGTGPKGQNVDLTWPITVFPIEHLAAGYRNGKMPEALDVVKKYDPALLSTVNLCEAARFVRSAGDNESARKWAEIALTRKDLSEQDKAHMNLQVAMTQALGESAISGMSKNPAEAAKVAENLRVGLALDPDPIRRMLAAARLIRVVGVEQSDVALAEKLYADAENDAKKVGIRDNMREAFRQATVAIGDVHLFALDVPKANEDYRVAENLVERPLPAAVRTAKVGSFPEAIEQQLQNKRPQMAMEVVKQWQNQIPSDQTRGASLFYLGKIEQMLSHPAAALRPLQLSIQLAQGAEFEAEARWLLAQTHLDLGDQNAHRLALIGLVKSGLDSPFRNKAMEVLGQLNKATTAPAGAKEQKP